MKGSLIVPEKTQYGTSVLHDCIFHKTFGGEKNLSFNLILFISLMSILLWFSSIACFNFDFFPYLLAWKLDKGTGSKSTESY